LTAKGINTDFIAISFSSTDYIGHKMGPQSIEVEDTYLRLDRDLGDLIMYLEKTYGKNSFLLFLTADHGAAYVPAQLTDDKIPAGYFGRTKMLDSLKKFLNSAFGNGNWVSGYINQQVYLNHELAAQKNISLKEMQEKAATYLLRFEGIANTYTSYQLNGSSFNQHPEVFLQNGFNVQRSGDVSVLLKPAWIEFYNSTTGILAWGIAIFRGGASTINTFSKQNIIFLCLSGIATGLSWIFYFKALQIGKVSQVAPVDKMSVAIAIILSVIFLGEP
jgi:hypothetical protein